MNNAGRIIGPALAGVTISVFGIGPCFLINAGSFVAVISALLLMQVKDMHVAEPQPRARRQVRDGLAVVRSTPEVRAVLVLGGLFFGLGWCWDIVMPLTAKYTFHGGAGLYGMFLSALGIGSIFGGLLAAKAEDQRRRTVLAIGVAVAVGGLAA